jgi:hypothetical protein
MEPYCDLDWHSSCYFEFLARCKFPSLEKLLYSGDFRRSLTLDEYSELGRFLQAHPRVNGLAIWYTGLSE